MGSLWGIATIVGPILFVAVLAFVLLRNRAASPHNREVAEQGAIDLREQLTAEREERERGNES